MWSKRIRSAIGFAALAASVLGQPAYATNPGASAAEMQLLPTWCRAIPFAGKTTPEASALRDPEAKATLARIDNSGCNGPWHYCWGLIRINRATLQARPAEEKPRLLHGAVADFEYAREHSGSSCTLIFDGIVKQGQVYVLLGAYKEAEEKFAQALAMKPGYAPAYIGLSDVYEGLQTPDKSVAILREGIKANPKSTALIRKLERVEKRMGSGSDTNP